MSIRLALSESSRNGDVNGSRFREGGRKRKEKEDAERARDGGARNEGDDEEARGGDQGMDVFTLYPLFF